MAEKILSLRAIFDKSNFKNKHLYKPLMHDFEYRAKGSRSLRSCVVTEYADGKRRAFDPVGYFSEGS